MTWMNMPVEGVHTQQKGLCCTVWDLATRVGNVHVKGNYLQHIMECIKYIDLWTVS